MRSERRSTNVADWTSTGPSARLEGGDCKPEQGTGGLGPPRRRSHPPVPWMPWSRKEHSALRRARSRSAPRTPKKLRVATVRAVAKVFLVATTLGPDVLSLDPFWHGRTARVVPPYRRRKSALCNRAGALVRQRAPPGTRGPRLPEALPQAATEPGVASVAGVQRFADLA